MPGCCGRSQQVIFTLRSAAPLDKGLCARLLASLQPDYEGFELKIENLFGYAMLDEAALRDLMEEMKRDGVPINGFLDRCTIGITGQKITIGVCHGTKFLQEMGFEKLLAERIAAHTGVKPQVTLQSAVSEAEQHQMEEKLERKIAPPVVKFEKKNTAPSIKVEGLDLTDKPVTIFHGKMFTPKNLTPLKDLGGEGGKCTIWGDVFFSEVKGNYRKIYTVSITDYQGSINLKIRAQEGEDCSKWESLGKGTTLIVRGDCSYDKYEHDYIVYPYDVLIVERKKREDTAPVKRVELHLHTKLSSMDGFCDPGGIVKLAHRMGHPAIAITDHGVCQGYPEAMLAADDIHKTDPDFKLIYGCEAYFVDDMIPCVYGVKDQPLDGEFCVFDTETTGLDPGVEYMTEIGAVIVKNGEVVEEFDTFVKPGKPITPKITELTGITNEMVANAPGEKEALEAFLKFAGDRILVGHNVHSFDMRFLRAAAKRSGISLEGTTYIDTLTMAQAMYPGLHNYKQGTINKHLELPAYEAHRACEDSAALGRIFGVMLNDLEEKQVTKVSEINTGLGGNREVLKKKYYHLIILVKNQMGLKNLYKIVSEAHVNYFFKKPRVPRSLLNKYRDGLLLTSACEAGELYRAIVDGTQLRGTEKDRILLRCPGNPAAGQQRLHGARGQGGQRGGHQELQPHGHQAGRRPAQAGHRHRRRALHRAGRRGLPRRAAGRQRLQGRRQPAAAVLPHHAGHAGAVLLPAQGKSLRGGGEEPPQDRGHDRQHGARHPARHLPAQHRGRRAAIARCNVGTRQARLRRPAARDRGKASAERVGFHLRPRLRGAVRHCGQAGGLLQRGRLSGGQPWFGRLVGCGPLLRHLGGEQPAAPLSLPQVQAQRVHHRRQRG